MRTSREGVYAAGDVTVSDQFVYMAAYWAKIAARNAMNGDSLTYDNAVMPAVVFADPQVASVGLTEATATSQGFSVRTSTLGLDNVPRALAARDTRGLIKLVADKETNKLLAWIIHEARRRQVLNVLEISYHSAFNPNKTHRPMKDTTKQSVLFNELSGKPVQVHFDQPDASSDGGTLPLKACDKRLGLTDALSACIRDDRQPGKINHSITDLLSQRVFGIACGYEDCNDVARVGDDPLHRLLVGRDPVSGDSLASQPTLSRFENQLDGRSLLKMGHALADTVMKRHRQRLKGKVRRITIDFDPTDDAAYGGQQLTFFNTHYGHWCYLPVACFLQFNDESDQYLYSYVLRPGNVKAHEGASALLRRTVAKLRQCFGAKVTLRVRLDGGYASPEVFDCLEKLGV